MKIVKLNNFIINVEDISYVGFNQQNEIWRVTILFKNAADVTIDFDTIEDAKVLMNTIESKIMEK